MFDLNYYNELGLIAKHIDNLYEEAKAWGMYKRSYCHRLDRLDNSKIRAEYIDTKTQVDIWMRQGHGHYIKWCCSQQEIKARGLLGSPH